MSVLACSRYGCENIMCDKQSNTYGYICNPCFEELVYKGVNTDIQDFMDSLPDHLIKEKAIAFFETEFPERD